MKPVEVSGEVQNILNRREVLQNMERIKKAGSEAIYVSCDILDKTGLNESLLEAQKKLGKITGIIHGAGIIADKLIVETTLSDFDYVFETKVVGLRHLLSSVNSDLLQHVIVFSSIAGFNGNLGQSVYSLTNEVLNKFIYNFKLLHDDCFVKAFNWGAWDYGMVVPSLKRALEKLNHAMISKEVGTAYMLNEVMYDTGDDPQIVISGTSHYDTQTLMKVTRN